MKLVIEIGGEATEVELGDGSWPLGGGADDAVVVPGVAPGAFELRVEGDRLMVRGAAPFAVDGVLSPAGVARLLLTGERVVLAEDVFLRMPAPGGDDAGARPQTAMVLKELLGGLEEPEDTTCAALVCLTGLDVGRRFPLAGESMELGRGDAVAVRVRDRAVSRRHARLRRTGDGGHTIEDLGAPNGLYVNGCRVSGPTPLPDGAVVEMGHSLLRYRAAPREPEPPEPSSAAAATGPNGSASLEVDAADPAAPPPGNDAPAEEGESARATPPVAKPTLTHHAEYALVAVGVLMALLGAVVTWNFVSGG